MRAAFPGVGVLLRMGQVGLGVLGCADHGSAHIGVTARDEVL